MLLRPLIPPLPLPLHIHSCHTLWTTPCEMRISLFWPCYLKGGVIGLPFYAMILPSCTNMHSILRVLTSILSCRSHFAQFGFRPEVCEEFCRFALLCVELLHRKGILKCNTFTFNVQSDYSSVRTMRTSNLLCYIYRAV